MGNICIKKREDNILPYDGKRTLNVGEDIIFPKRNKFCKIIFERTMKRVPERLPCVKGAVERMRD